MRGRDKRYALDQCALYRCRSREKLFKLLQTTEKRYDELRAMSNLYRPIKKTKKNGAVRIVYSPHGSLKRVQARLSDLLMRLAPPDFLMSPVRGRSNIDNAARHRGSKTQHLLDVADFYPSCSGSKVAEFFSKVLGCPPDVVAILTWLATKDDALPQGSPASPILAYWAYREMWDEIDTIAQEGHCTLSVYVDDVTLSGLVVTGATVHRVKRCLRHHGHAVKESKEAARIDSPVTITGVVVRRDQLLLPNVQHKERHHLRKALETMAIGMERAKVEASLAGKDEVARQISKRNIGG